MSLFQVEREDGKFMCDVAFNGERSKGEKSAKLRLRQKTWRADLNGRCRYIVLLHIVLYLALIKLDTVNSFCFKENVTNIDFSRIICRISFNIKSSRSSLSLGRHGWMWDGSHGRNGCRWRSCDRHERKQHLVHRLRLTTSVKALDTFWPRRSTDSCLI